MGEVLLIWRVQTGIEESVAAVGMKPEKKPVTFDCTLLMGVQGLLNAA